MAWLTGYEYRKQISITGQAGSGTNYQVKLEVYSGFGSDSAGVVYLSRHCHNFPGDIRFTDDDETTELDHWLEDVDDDRATFWIEIADDLGSNQNFYIYYGHETASSDSNGDATFLFFDDFEDSILDAAKWSVVQGTLELEDCAVPAANLETFCQPNAEYYQGTYRRTYISYLNRNKEVQVLFYDHDTGHLSSPVTVHTYGSLDNHGAPALVVLPSGKILLFYALHNSTLYSRKSANAEDISAWDSAVTVDSGACTYPQPFVASDDDVWVFYRYNAASDQRTICYRVSSDEGDSWGSRTTLVDFGSGYWLYPQVANSGTEVHVVWSKYSDPGAVRENIYYIYSPDDGSTWKIRDGTSKTPPIDETEADLVYDTATGKESFIMDIKLDGLNDPYIAFLDEFASDPCDARFAFYDAAWETHLICDIEKTSYGSGAISIDDNDVYAVYAGVPDAGKSEIQKWTSADNGDTWAFSESITDASNYDHHSPVMVKNYHSDLSLLWKMLRHWTSSSDYDFCLMSHANGMSRALELQSTTGTRGAIEGQTSFASSAVLAGRAVSSLPVVNLTYFFRMRKSGDGNEKAGSFSAQAVADEVRFATVRGGVTETTSNISVDEITSWTRYSVHWDGLDDAEAYIDGSLVATHTSRVSSQDQVVLIGAEGNVGEGVWLLDWLFVRKYNDPEPIVGIAQSEEGIARIPRPPGCSPDIIIL